MILKALNNIQHNGAVYELGEFLDVADDDQAQALIDAGSAELAPAGAEAKKPGRAAKAKG